jgi:hypothetical protein
VPAGSGLHQRKQRDERDGAVTPRIEGTAGEHLRYLVRSSNAWLNESGATATIVGSTSEGYFGSIPPSSSETRLRAAGGSRRSGRNALPDSTLLPW